MWLLFLLWLPAQQPTPAELQAELDRLNAKAAALEKADEAKPDVGRVPGMEPEAKPADEASADTGNDSGLAAILATVGSALGAGGVGAVAYKRLRKKTKDKDGSETEEEIVTVNLKTGKPFPRGARSSPRHVLAGATPYKMIAAPPTQFANIPKQLDMWGNDTYGDCVTAEEAFAKACYLPEVFIDAKTVEAWASAHGVLNGAALDEVLDGMAQKGFQIGSQLYNDGGKLSVNWSDEPTLQAAIASNCPVKIAIDANGLPSGAGNQSGWYVLGGKGGQSDHCVGLSGFGPADYLYKQLGVSLPSALTGKSGYLLYTWSTIGFVDHAWLMGYCDEAWVRQPTTVGVPPLQPTPGPTPTPTPDGFTPPFFLWVSGSKVSFMSLPDLASATSLAQMLLSMGATDVVVKDSLDKQAWPAPTPSATITLPDIKAGNYKLVSA